MSPHRGDPCRHIRVLNNLFNKKSVYSDLIFSRFEWENYCRFFKISPLPCAKFSKEKRCLCLTKQIYFRIVVKYIFNLSRSHFESLSKNYCSVVLVVIFWNLYSVILLLNPKQLLASKVARFFD